MEIKMEPFQMRNLAELKAFCEAGGKPAYLFFWGHHPRQVGVIDKTCLSNWYPAGFESEGHWYFTSEHCLMAQKAWLFGDQKAFEEIRLCSEPAEAKDWGRKIRGFDESLWLMHRWEYNLRANLEKFSQNPELKTFLLGTGTQVLVEASPVDAIWGIGLAANDPRAHDPMQWKGLNLLGFALMEVRSRLSI